MILPWGRDDEAVAVCRERRETTQEHPGGRIASPSEFLPQEREMSAVWLQFLEGGRFQSQRWAGHKIEGC